ncbi:MAG TPA: alpha/beta fold hydrolase [Pseudonocardiaceae bacterium]|jgi:pimeloyl-ACP methyl ester carboxylesterase|nr:alpha/beta fold hydrolase [Pseudonocardiaceae bacterium]
MAMLPDGVRALEVETSQSTVHLLTAGDPVNPTLVLVHGNVASARFFAETMATLAADWYCLAPDLRGFGRSQRLPVDARRGMRDFSDDLHALLTEARSESGAELVPAGRRVWMLGWSLGAGAVLQYAIDRPGALAGVILEAPLSPYGFGGTRDLDGTPCWPDFAGSGGGTANPAMIERIVAGDRGDEVGTSPRRVITGLYGNPPFELAPEVIDELVEGILELAIGDDNYPGDSLASPNWPGMAPGERGVNNALSPKYCDLSGFAAITDRPPVCWLRGDADQIVSDAAAVDLGALGQLGVVPGWPGVRVYPPQPMVGQTRAMLERYQAAGGSYREHLLPGCGHSPHLERPAEFCRLITEFRVEAQRSAGKADPIGPASE